MSESSLTLCFRAEHRDKTLDGGRILRCHQDPSVNTDADSGRRRPSIPRSLRNAKLRCLDATGKLAIV
jgi:hypothetical protein